MRLTPLDIQQRQFGKSFRGYDENDVDEFIGRISKDYETVHAENRTLREQTDRLKEQIKDYIDLERTLKQTLVSAQKTSQEMKSNSERESELILKEAELKAEKIVQQAREETRTLLKEIQQLRKQKRLFKLELKNLIDSFRDILDSDDKGVPSRAAAQLSRAGNDDAFQDE